MTDFQQQEIFEKVRAHFDQCELGTLLGIRNLLDSTIVAKKDEQLVAFHAREAELRREAEALGIPFGMTYKVRAPGAPKYRNPANPGQTWTGRGKTPKWVSALQAQGTALDELLIEKPGMEEV